MVRRIDEKMNIKTLYNDPEFDLGFGSDLDDWTDHDAIYEKLDEIKYYVNNELLGHKKELLDTVINKGDTEVSQEIYDRLHGIMREISDLIVFLHNNK